MDWDDLRSFLMVARHRSLSAGARALRVTQSTMGRRLERMEEKLGARLLQKTPDGYVLTSIGEGILAAVERIESETFSIGRAISGRDVRLEGLVRIATVEAFGARLLTPLLAEFRRQYPGIAVELLASTRALNLFKREADIALRFARLEQHDLITWKLGDMAFALYAARAYIAERGQPSLDDGCVGHATIALQEDLADLPEARWLGAAAARAEVALVSNSREIHLRGVLAGLGLACLPCYLADPEPELVRLTKIGAAPVREIWLGVHRDTRHVPRIRAALDFLTDAVKRQASTLMPM